MGQADPAEHWVVELTRLGMTIEAASSLVEESQGERGCSLHEVVELLESGCPPEVAFDIAS
jgi:hypothetical protein